MPPGVKYLPPGIAWHTPKGRRPGYTVRLRYGRKIANIGRYEYLQDAKAALSDAKKRIREGRFIPPDEIRRRALLEQDEQDRQRLTVAEYAETWLAAPTKDGEERKPATVASYRSILDAHILPAFGDRWMVDVSQAAVDHLLREVRRKSGPGAERNVKQVLRSLFLHAIKNRAGGLIKMPFEITLKKVKYRRADEVPTPAEVTLISEHMPPELRLAPLLSAVCALRPGETLGLQRRDLAGLDTDRPVLKVRRQWNSKTSPPSYTDPKQDSERDVTIPRFLVPQIIDHLVRFVDDSPEAPLFASPKGRTRPLSHNTYRQRWNRAVEAAGVDPYVLHSLRHLGLTLIAIAGATQTEVAARGGHKDMEAAARYQHALDRRAVELAAALGAQWEGQQ